MTRDMTHTYDVIDFPLINIIEITILKMLKPFDVHQHTEKVIARCYIVTAGYTIYICYQIIIYNIDVTKY